METNVPMGIIQLRVFSQLEVSSAFMCGVNGQSGRNCNTAPNIEDKKSVIVDSMVSPLYDISSNQYQCRYEKYRH